MENKFMKNIFNYDVCDDFDNGFDLVEFVSKDNEKFVFMLMYDYGGSLCEVDLIWGNKELDEKFVKECEDKCWGMEDE
tara:strand:- start:45 stop:278 length:234 start_codon:yes stop_codon:yes gene_type:complete